MDKRPWRKQVVSGLRLVALAIAGFLVFGLLLWGAGVAYSKLPGPKGPAWVALVVAGGIVVQTAQRWAKVLPGLLILAAFNALISAGTGHLINNTKVPFPREVALAATLLFATSSVLSAQFYDRRLSLVDRTVLVAYVAFVVWGWLTNRFLTSLTLGVVAFSVAWLNHRYRQHRA